jgi:hypothetical protein
MKNLKRAAKKRESKKFHIGDYVTWGNCSKWYKVVAVSEKGVTVDVTGEENAENWAIKQHDGRFFALILYDRNLQGLGPRCRFRDPGLMRGPPIKIDPEEETLKRMECKLRYDN